MFSSQRPQPHCFCFNLVVDPFRCELGGKRILFQPGVGFREGMRAIKDGASKDTKRPVRVDLVGQSESVTPRTPAPKSYGIDCSWINDQALTFVAWPWHRLGAAQRRELG